MARYEEIASDMRRQLMAGAWGDEGDRIPTVANLMDTYGITSSQTIRSAQAVLIKEGLLVARQGSGVYIAQRPSAQRMGVLAAREAIAAAGQRLVEAATALDGQPLPLRVRIDYNGREGVFADSGAHSAWVVCEVCNRPITKQQPGIVTLPAGEPPRTASVRFVHKITCDFEPGAACYELDDFLRWLHGSLIDE